ncbi:unnamed protein product [Owenia fusiformis]|uniref:Kinesin-like protein n=1 Tax=Owenia fusiformis TaxID=6347 RepID=A0A8S4Q6Z3_OWEFU|nr:unnamed protein product [Owenia fusiformis]
MFSQYLHDLSLVGVDDDDLEVEFEGGSLGSGLAEPDLESEAETDNINVVIRVRPQNAQELERHDKQSIIFPGDGALHIDNQGSNKTFTFNVTFEPEAQQDDVFDHSGIKKLIDMSINGYSCTCFAFGQTGSGKTHTITGPPDVLSGANEKMDNSKMGLIPRSFRYLFQQLDRRKATTTYTIHASYLEIYNEQVIDLLNPGQRKHLSVRWSKTQGFYVENLFVIECEMLDDLQAILEEGLRNRQTSSHSMNDFSSRSHSILTLMIDSEIADPDDPNLYITKHGKLTFVDLAGSEKVKDTNATGESLVESNNINRSLLVLGNCISALGDSKKKLGHIPYRDSKLTKLLADSLGGSGVTLMIACVSTASYNVSETMNTLRYANRAKKIKNKPVIRMDPREKLIMTLKREVKTLRQENVYLRQQLDFPDRPKGQQLKENDPRFLEWLKQQKQTNKNGKDASKVGNKKSENSGKDKEKKALPPSDDGLYEILQEYMVENEVLRSENSDLQASQDRYRRDKQEIAKENEKLARRLEDLERMGIATPLSIHSVSTYNGSSAFSSRDITPTNFFHRRPSFEFYNGNNGGSGYDVFNSQSPQQRGQYMPQSGNASMPNDLPFLQSPTNGYPTPPVQGRPAGPLPSQNLQHPRRPPHRLSDPVARSDKSPKRNNPPLQGYSNRFRHSHENLSPRTINKSQYSNNYSQGSPREDPRLRLSDPQGVYNHGLDPRGYSGGYREQEPYRAPPPVPRGIPRQPAYPGSAPNSNLHAQVQPRNDKSAYSEPGGIYADAKYPKPKKIPQAFIEDSHSTSATAEVQHINDKLRDELAALDSQIKFHSTGGLR